jgi:drug/metabolite transporter (DMT)-like permease
MSSNQQVDSVRGPLAVFIAACILGFAPILVKAADLGPQAIAFWRLTLALPLLSLWLGFELWRNRSTPGFWKPPGWKMLGLAGIFFAGDLAFWHFGIKITTAANATLLANLTPIPVTIAAFLLFGEAITKRLLISGSIALLGAFLLAYANLQFAPERLIGDVFSTLTACWYAAYLLAVRAARRAGAATVQVMFWSTLVGSPILLLVTPGVGEPILPSAPSDWFVLLGLGFIVHIGGQGGIAYGLGRTPAALATLIILIQPVVAALAGWVLFSEALVPIQWLGAALVLLGVYVAQNQKQSPRPDRQGAINDGQ